MSVTTAIILAALLIGLAKGGLGPVPGALITPLLSLTMPVSEAVGVALPLLMLGDLFAMRVYWRRWDTRLVRLMLPGALAGVAMGLALLTTLPDDVLQRVLGAFTLVAVAYKLASDSLGSFQYTPRPWHGTLAGWGSGFGSALANSGAPPVTAYLLLQRVKPQVFIATTVLFFFVINLVKLPVFLAADVLDPGRVVRYAWVLPLVPLGVWAGKWLIERIDPLVFERLMLVLLAWAGIMLLV